jgi:hypothetical protein
MYLPLITIQIKVVLRYLEITLHFVVVCDYKLESIFGLELLETLHEIIYVLELCLILNSPLYLY